MSTIDYAIMNTVSNSGSSTQETIDRLVESGQYGMRSFDYTNVMFVVNRLIRLGDKNPKVKKHVKVWFDSFDSTGSWIRTPKRSWRASGGSHSFHQTPQELNQIYSDEDVAEVRRLISEYEYHDRDKKLLVIVGFTNVNVEDPYEMSRRLSRDMIVMNTGGYGKLISIIRGGPLEPGVRIFNEGAPIFFVDEYEGAPRRLAREARHLFQEAFDNFREDYDGTVRRHCVYDEFPRIERLLPHVHQCETKKGITDPPTLPKIYLYRKGK
jgi:hypothetical protein